MFSALSDFSPYLVYAAPPLVGAFIGYLTNRVAIRMLFRPLKKWTIGPIRIPMTPGVIPSKRHEFAANIGTMVGEHLLTGDELNRSLLKEPFQTHLFEVIHTRLSRITQLDLGSVNNIVPDTYRSYLDIALKTVIYRLKGMVRQSIGSDFGEQAIEKLIDRWLDEFFKRDLRKLVSVDDADQMFSRLESSISELLADADLTPVLTSIFSTAMVDVINQKKSLNDLLPSQIQETIIDTVRDQAPFLLEKASEILKDPEIQEKVIDAMKQGVEEMVDGMGPMSTMVKGFLDMDLVDQTIREYLIKREDDISDFLSDDAINFRVRAGLGERINLVLAQPLAHLFETSDRQRIHLLAKEVAQGVENVLHGEQIRDRISAAVREIVEKEYQKNNTSVATVLERFAGADTVDTIRTAVKREIISLLESSSFATFLDGAVETLCMYLVNKPIGKLSYLIPARVVDEAAQSLTLKTTQTMVEEMPVIIASLDIRKIITERIDSFDLLRLEQLLLSIMKEQFKYINLFGALLGFLIGCLNLLFIIGTG